MPPAIQLGPLQEFSQHVFGRRRLARHEGAHHDRRRFALFGFSQRNYPFGSIASVREGIIIPSLSHPVSFMTYTHRAHRPSLLVSQNPLGLPHEKELAKRRQLAHERSQRAASEALRTLRERQQSTEDTEHAGKDGQS